MNWQGKWITNAKDMGDLVPAFTKSFDTDKEIHRALLYISAIGVYEASINGLPITDQVLTPGWTAYRYRIQYQTYDVSHLVSQKNTIEVTVGKGWHKSPLMGFEKSPIQQELMAKPTALIAELHISYTDGQKEIIPTNDTWTYCESAIRFSEIYDGEIYDASFDKQKAVKETVTTYDMTRDILVPDEGEAIKEIDRIHPRQILVTPKGEYVIDFGQEITGYVELTLSAKSGDLVELSHGEVFDKEGNFYNDNYRDAKAKLTYTCSHGVQKYKPHHTFYGFRYVRIDAFPGGPQSATLENFKGIVVHSDMERTGHLSSSNPDLNQLFDNIFWGQKGNFLDVPTDCPQRNERLGWTGDAQVFVKTAAYNYNVENFFTKWLKDLALDQKDNGQVGFVIPDVLNEGGSSAWGDAATICPWEIYLAYGDPKILENQFESMKKWISYIKDHTTTPNLWTGTFHFGDWLGLDAPSGSYKGSSREDLIATAYYAYSTSLVIKSGRILGQDTSYYEDLYKAIVSAFRAEFTEFITQTECTLAIHFNLAKDCQAVADQLADMVTNDGIQLRTGFVGTPYILHALSSYGYTDLAYSLLLRKEYPSWIYPVTKGATTIWEHWDGIMENGDFWSRDMNSFNHYAYGAVADWVYGVAGGIKPIESKPGYEEVSISPNPDTRLDWLKTSLKTKHGLIRSEWKKQGQSWRYEIETPVKARITIAGHNQTVLPGTYTFYSPIQ